MKNNSLCYRGPVLVTDPGEVARILRWAEADKHPDEVTLSLRAKATAALTADPKLRTPTK